MSKDLFLVLRETLTVQVKNKDKKHDIVTIEICLHRRAAVIMYNDSRVIFRASDLDSREQCIQKCKEYLKNNF